MSLDLGHEVSGLFGGASSTITGQVRTNLGPLTTTFTQPPSCTIAIAEQEDNVLTGFLAYTCALSQHNTTGLDNTSCWPGTSSGAATPSVPFQGWGFYSPGTVCPTGYSSACSATGGASSSSGWPVQFQLLEGETAVGCCPSGFACGNVGGQTCIQTATSVTIPTARCEYGTITDSETVVLSATPASITAATLFAPMFQINWQSSDGPKFAATPQTSRSLSQPTSTGSTVSSATGAPSLVGTQTITTEISPTGGLEMASTSEIVVTTAPASSAIPSNNADSDSEDDDQAETSNEDKDGFPVGATIGVSVAGGLGATAVAVWAVIMWQRRRQWKSEKLQDISDDRMLHLDSIYEAARPKTFDTAGRETVFGLERQDTFPSRPDSDLMYGPGQETSRVLRAGPRRSPQLVGGFPGATMEEIGHPTDTRNLPKDGGLGPYYHQR